MHTDAHRLIWGHSVIQGDNESLVLTRALWMSIVACLIMATSQSLSLCTRHGDVLTPTVTKPAHLMAGHALNIQVFVMHICEVVSSLPDFVGQIQASINSATCTVSFGLTKLRIFSSSKNQSVPYEGK